MDEIGGEQLAHDSYLIRVRWGFLRVYLGNDQIEQCSS